MTKNNIGEAIVIVGVIFSYLYFKPENFVIVALMIVFVIISFMTWVYVSEETRTEGNRLSFKETELKIKKLELEIEQMRNKK